METVLDLKQTFSSLPSVGLPSLRGELSRAADAFQKKIVVLDDDPTGSQTVHGLYVYTGWEERDLMEAFSAPEKEFYILTNSRSFSRERVVAETRKIARHIVKASRKTGMDYIIISRSDSTLRGHFPLETQILREELEHLTGKTYDGEILIPFFKEGGRYTIEDVHYVAEDSLLIPAAQTAYAEDKTFGYANSNLRLWIDEKTEHAFPASEVTSIGIAELRSGSFQQVADRLMSVHGFGKVIVNAVDDADLALFSISLAAALSKGKEFLFRTAASFPKVIGGISDRGLLTADELAARQRGSGGLVIVGSHVPKTTEQLRMLEQMQQTVLIEFNQHLITDPEAFVKERRRVQAEIEQNLKSGGTVVVYTRRSRLDLGNGDGGAELALSRKISDAVTGFVENLSVRPNYIIAKGGITSSEIATKALRIKKAFVLGQILEGIPVWMAGDESKFPGLPYVVFPGNVGNQSALLRVISKMNGAAAMSF